MSPGDGVSLITADGTGDLVSDGIGSRPAIGVPDGSTGIMEAVITVGAL